MFSWLKRKSAKKPVIDNRYGFIDERGLFNYRRHFDSDYRVMDVFAVDANLNQFGGDNWTDAITVLRAAKMASEYGGPKQAQAAVKQRLAAFRDISELSRKVFGLDHPSAESGWSDSEAFVLFCDYIAASMEVRNEFLPLPKLPA